MSDFPEPGFYGKLPAYGDFIQKRLPRDFVTAWDDWLQVGISGVRERLGDNWLSYYLNCPAWKFVLGEGICGAQACAGVTIPSCDKVGRYFNFTLAVMLPAGTRPSVFMAGHGDWFAALENLALTALEQELDQDAIDDEIGRLTPLPGADEMPGSAQFSESPERIRVASAESRPVGGLWPDLLHHLVNRGQAAYGLWWHGGSSQVAAQLVACPAGMPSFETYQSLMMDEQPEVAQLTEPEQESSLDYIDELLSS